MAIPSYKSVLKHYESSPEEVKKFFSHLPKLIEHDMPWEVIIAYQFVRVEFGQNRTLYGGLVKRHRANASVTTSMLSLWHITRRSFLSLVKTIFGEVLDKPIAEKLKEAEKVRDKSVHGKSVIQKEARQAIVDVLDYAANLNAWVDTRAKFKPFDDMRGFKGATEPLPKDTTGWLLRGIWATAVPKAKKSDKGDDDATADSVE